MRHATPLTRTFVSLVAAFLVGIVASGALSACKKSATADSRPHVVPATDLLEVVGTDVAPLIIDVRTAGEYAAGHVPGAVNIPYDQMENRVAEIRVPKDQEIVLYCRSGRRSGLAAKTLAAHGFTNLGLLEGDMPGWEASGLPVEK